MLSRFFHLRAKLKPFASPSARVSSLAFDARPPTATGGSEPHRDYDRRTLQTHGFDHYIERAEDGARFQIH